MSSLRRLKLRVIASSVVLIMAATVAVILVSGAHGESGTATPTGQSRQAAAFAVLRRAPTPQDQLPQVFQEHPHPALADATVSDSRLAFTRGEHSYFVVPKGDDEICLVNWAPRTPGGTDVACTTFESALNADTPMSANGPGGAHGIVPDGITRVRTTSWNGETKDAFLSDNVFVAAGDVVGKAITLTASDGRDHRFELPPEAAQPPAVDASE